MNGLLHPELNHLVLYISGGDMDLGHGPFLHQPQQHEFGIEKPSWLKMLVAMREHEGIPQP
jgi:hypothetical protein